MPNKHKKKKFITKLLISGKLDKNENVKRSRELLSEKIAMDQEDIDFDYDPSKNGDFEKLDPSEDKPTKQAKKRKTPPTRPSTDDSKKPKLQMTTTNTSSSSSSSSAICKKSKKNKYFFMAHPEALKSKDGILASLDDSVKSKFVIDEEKLKLDEKKKKLKKKSKGEEGKATKATTNGTKKEKNNKKKKPKMWAIEVCSGSSDEDEIGGGGGEKKPKVANVKMPVINIDDVDKSFKIKKTIKTLEDGSRVEVICPEFVQEEADNEVDEVEEEEDATNEGGENEYASDEETEKINGDESNKSNPLVDKLKASRFRFLNEMLYTQPSDKSFDFFKDDADAFKAYHEGFQQQVSKWPMNPLDEIVEYIKKRPANLVVADFGCGEARLAASVKNTVHSFDLAKANDRVTVCDMRQVPLENDSCDIVVFCLSLMGTNVVEFLCEAHRVLKPKGVLKIAEVVSRIEDKGKFMQKIESMGFKIVNNKKDPNSEKGKNYFYFFDFVKTSPKVNKRPEIKLLPCIYKKR